MVTPHDTRGPGVTGMRDARQPSGLVRRPLLASFVAVVLAAVLAVLLPLVDDRLALRQRALASLDPAPGPLQITSPADGAVLGDGNLVFVEGSISDPADV